MAIINIFGVIGREVRANEIVKQILATKDDTIEVNIMSLGGSVNEGFAIYDALKDSDKKIITRAIGQAASIASIIFAAGDEREITENAEIMIHNSMTPIGGNKNELEEKVKLLSEIDKRMIAVYSRITGLKEDELSQMLDKETFMSADEALNKGFATSKTNSLALVAMVNSTENIIKEPETMAETKPEEEVKVEEMASNKKTKEGFIAHVFSYFAKDEEKAPGTHEFAEDEEVEDGDDVTAEEEVEETEKETVESLKAKIAEMEEEMESLKASKAEAEEEKAEQAKQESDEKVVAILDAVSDQKLTTAQAKNLSNSTLEDVKAKLEELEPNATGRGSVGEPKAEAKVSHYEQFKALSGSEQNAYYNKYQSEIDKEMKEAK